MRRAAREWSSGERSSGDAHAEKPPQESPQPQPPQESGSVAAPAAPSEADAQAPPATAAAAAVVGLGSVRARAAAGPVASWVREHCVSLTLQLMGAIKMGEASVETMCVINAAIVFFVIAEHRGGRKRLLAKLMREATRREAAAPTAAPVNGVFEGFLQLLGFWSEVYCSHSCERRFLEFSSGIPFERWRSTVQLLTADLKELVAEIATGGAGAAAGE